MRLANLSVEAMVFERSRQAPELEDLGRAVVGIAHRVLDPSDVRIQAITYRVKDAESLRRKLTRPERRYKSLNDITDLLGVRVITYFPGDVDKAAALIEGQFDIDRANSVDRRTTLEPDRFGYLSLHYVAKLPRTRRVLVEHAGHRNQKFEIQIRSILQHAWAEIEHDLGYRTDAAIPAVVRRRFSRLAGLLEIADSEFEAIRNDLTGYTEMVSGFVATDRAAVDVNRDSVTAYVNEDPLVRAVDLEVAAEMGDRELVDVSPEYAEWRTENLNKIGFESLGEVHSALDRNREAIIQFARIWNSDEPAISEEVVAGISLFYLYLLELARAVRNGRKELIADLRFGSELTSDELYGEKLAAALVSTLAAVEAVDRKAD